MKTKSILRSMVVTLFAVLAVSVGVSRADMDVEKRDQGRIFGTDGELELGTAEWAQSITTGISGQLTKIVIQFHRVSAQPPALKLSIFDGGNPRAGSALFSEELFGTKNVYTWDLRRASLYFNVGDVFSFVLQADAAGYNIAGNDPPGYAGGELFKNGVPYTELSDIAFITKVNPAPLLIGEVGTVRVNQLRVMSWHTVQLEHTYVDPVVVMGPLTRKGRDPSHTRIRSVGEDSFKLKIEEWDYLNGTHPKEEEVSYLVMETGVHSLHNGARIQVGKTTMDGELKTVRLHQAFDNKPVVLACTQTYTGTDAVVVHIERVFKDAFRARLREQEAYDDIEGSSSHKVEEVGYIAIEQGHGGIGAQVYEAGLTPRSVNHKWYTIIFNQAFQDIPEFLAQENTGHGDNPSSLRLRVLDTDGVDVLVEEEQSRDMETEHAKEQVGYVAIEPAGSIVNPIVTFTPIEWTITPDNAGPGIHSIFMIADANPLRVDELQDLGGRLVWEGAQIILCSDPSFPPPDAGIFISIRGVGDGYLRIGDGFQTNNQGPGCSINTTMQDVFDDLGLPETACLSVRTGAGIFEYCAPLNVQ